MATLLCWLWGNKGAKVSFIPKRQEKEMGWMLDADSYFPCLKRNVWVPNYAEEIHTAECHELRLMSFSHKYVVGSSLYGQIITTGAVQLSLKKRKEEMETKKRKTVKKEGTERNKEGHKGFKKLSIIDGNKINWKSQVDWLKKIFYGFCYRIFVKNGRDLILCNLCASTLVEVKFGSTSCVFLVIPDETVQIGHVTLPHKSKMKG
ncbi:hypothetical protein Hamer_G020561 [Homarus americanus]|uniref:Uncharacterized protein n=1 Tax=Homarus americanus TaxID=6706 RepID=A0A8J5JF19_HOMAM|nr:hypothetical protein Hamer_G020561 [Homarus americanus]